MDAAGELPGRLRLSRETLLIALAFLVVAIPALVIGAGSVGPDATPPTAAPAAETAAATKGYAQLPLAFEPNAGRFEPGIRFVASSRGGSIAAGPRGILLERAGSDPITMAPLGGTLAELTPVSRLPGVVNDLRGDDSSQWKTGIPTYSRLRYESVYPGIDLDLYGSQAKGGTLEYDFRLAPDADPERIAVSFGEAPVRIAADGSLVAGSGTDALRQAAPVAFQPSSSGRTPVEVTFDDARGGIGFELGAYDRSRPLVIDPLLIDYSTYLGGDGDDNFNDIVVDGSGSAYVGGLTDSTDFNLEGEISDTPVGFDGFVSKLSPSGDSLVYSTYLGGNASDFVNGIAVDDGSVYIAGSTSSTDFPVVGSLGTGDQPLVDGWVAKLNPAGSAFVYSAYLGGDNTDFLVDVAVAANGAAFYGGRSSSSDYPTANQIEGRNSGAAFADGIITKVNPAGTALAYSTYLGGNDEDFLNAIAIDSAGAAYVGGTTDSADYNLANPIQGDQPESDAFVSKLTPAGTGLAYSTYLGGDALEEVHDLTVDADGALHAVGSTDSSDYPTTDDAAMTGPLGEQDGFVTKLGPTGDSLGFSTYIGGADFDQVRGVDVDPAGSVYIAGPTRSPDFPVVGGIGGRTAPVAFDSFLARLDPGGSEILLSGVIGGSGLEGAVSSAMDSSESIYMTGGTDSTDYPIVSQIEADSAGKDGFITKIDTPPETSIISGPAQGATIADPSPSFGYASSQPGSTFQCSVDGTAFAACPSTHILPALSDGAHTVRVRAVDPGGNPDGSPAGRGFTVEIPDPGAPETTITEKPKRKLKLKRGKKSVRVEFGFSADEDGSSFECRLDDGAFEDCSSPRAIKLRKGEHIFAVRASDAAGNTDPTPAAARVRVKKAKKKR